MTYDEVMALSGRELDAAVAEHVIGAGSSAAWDYSARIEPALHAMRHILSRGAWAQNMFYAALWGQAPAAGPARWKFEHTLTALILGTSCPRLSAGRRYTWRRSRSGWEAMIRINANQAMKQRSVASEHLER